MRALAPAALALAACGGSAPEPAAAPAPEGTVVVVPPALEEEPSAPGLPDEIPPPPKVACSIAGERLGSRATLRLAEGGPAFASVWGGEARLEVALDRPEASRLSIEKDGVSLRGKTGPRGEQRGRRGGIDLFPAEPLVFEGLAVTRSSARLAWEDAKAGELRARLELGYPVQGRPSLRRAVPCAKLALGPASFDPRAALSLGKPLREASLAPDRRVPVAASPGGEAAFEVLEPATEEDAASLARTELEVHGTKGPHVKVLVPAGEALVFGWVPSKDLAKPPEPYGLLGVLGSDGHGMLGGLLGNATKRSATLLACPRPLTLLARAGGAEARVGSVSPGTKIELVEKVEGGRSVRLLASGWMRLEPGATLVVPSAEAKGCEETRASLEEPAPLEFDFGDEGLGIGD